jgi:hypothetical protein
MKARPILFSGPMVLALLEGRKTQTRRTKGLEYFSKPKNDTDNWHLSRVVDGAAYFYYKHSPGEVKIECPHGRPGDLLWVRETMRCSDGVWHYDADREPVLVHKNCESAMISWAHHKDAPVCTSIYMPRFTSRITQRITRVRVERLHDISEDDAKAEGCRSVDYATGREVILDPGMGSYRLHFSGIWNTINGAGAWDANPWVWALTFEVIKRNVDEVLKEAA